MRVVPLDIARFIAAISVVLYHFISRPESMVFPDLAELTKFGYLGVPFFFIISGFVIAMSASNRSAMQFAISRFVRLYPALWAGVVFTVLVTYILNESSYSVFQVLANFTLLNEYLGFEDVDGVYWTLKAELKFYACIFILVGLRLFDMYKIWLTIWLLITIMYSSISQPFFMGWFISPEYSPFFIAGVGFYLVHHHGMNGYNLLVLSVAALLSCFHAYEQTSGFILNTQREDRLISVAIVLLMFVFMYFLALGRFKLRSRRWYVTLGALTYPLYLIHNVAGKAIIDEFSPMFGEELMVLVTILMMLFFSYALHRLVEKPLATPMKNYMLGLLNRIGRSH